MVFVPAARTILVEHEAVVGPDALAVRDWARGAQPYGVPPTIYIEDYKPRHHYAPDMQMVTAVQRMRKETAGILLANTGVKKVVRRQLMELVGVWSFTTSTHHQDLRSAARIALLGMLKHAVTNELLADIVADHLKGTTWQVKS
jgi:hypothetical protein